MAIIGAGLVGMSTAIELLDQSHEVFLVFRYLFLQCLDQIDISIWMRITKHNHIFAFFQSQKTYFCKLLSLNIHGLVIFQLVAVIWWLLWFFQFDIYESRPLIWGKVGSFVDRGGNHIEMGLYVFFGCYNNLFRLMKKVKQEALW